jgi:hypothetical protein
MLIFLGSNPCEDLAFSEFYASQFRLSQLRGTDPRRTITSVISMHGSVPRKNTRSKINVILAGKMAKKRNKAQKKRHKPYTGEEAAIKGVKVTKVTAVKKSPIREWWDTKRKVLAVWLALLGLLLIVGWLLSAFFSWIF